VGCKPGATACPQAVSQSCASRRPPTAHRPGSCWTWARTPIPSPASTWPPMVTSSWRGPAGRTRSPWCCASMRQGTWTPTRIVWAFAPSFVVPPSGGLRPGRLERRMRWVTSANVLVCPWSVGDAASPCALPPWPRLAGTGPPPLRLGTSAVNPVAPPARGRPGRCGLHHRCGIFAPQTPSGLRRHGRQYGVPPRLPTPLCRCWAVTTSS
jgi:hypothetical protein